MKDYIRLISLIKPHTWVVVMAILCMVASSLFAGVSLGMIIPFVDNVISGKGIPIPEGVAIPQAVLNLINKINNLSPLTLLNWLIIWVMVMFLLKEIFTYFQTYFMNDLSQRVIRDIKNKVYEKFLDLSLDFYSKHATGKLTSRVTYDATIIRNSISEGFTDLLYQPIQLIIYVVIVLVVRSYFSIPWLLLILSVIILPSLIYPILRIGKRLRKISEQSQQKMGDITTALFETITGMRIVKAFSMEKYELARFKEHNMRFYKLVMKSIMRMEIISPMTEFVGIICVATVAWFGSKEIVSGHLSAGAFITFLAALLSLLKPFKRLSRLHSINQEALAAARRIFEVLDIDPTVKDLPGAPPLQTIKKDIAFNHVYFKYEDKEVLKDININVKTGEIIAVVGPTGAGKTTLVNLIPRFYDPIKGSITIDGVDTKTVSLKSLRDQIGIVTQDMILFNDTVANNISYGKVEGVKMEDVINAAKIANAHLFIENLPKKYDTIVGEKGFRLSGGEKQRLTIARAIFKNPPILILDEATSHLDAEAEKLVQEAVDRLMSGRTVFVIAHRLSTVRRADRIIVLEKGKITEIGNHDSLIKDEGLYKRLYEMQFIE